MKKQISTAVETQVKNNTGHLENEVAKNNSITPQQQILLKLLDAFGKGVNNVVEFFHPDAVIEYPYARMLGTPERLGLGEYRDYIANALEIMPGIRFSKVVTYQTVDPDVVIMECHGAAKVPDSVEVYNQDYFMVVRFREAKIIMYKEYWNPLELQAFGGHSNARDLFRHQ